MFIFGVNSRFSVTKVISDDVALSIEFYRSRDQWRSWQSACKQISCPFTSSKFPTTTASAFCRACRSDLCPVLGHFSLLLHPRLCSFSATPHGLSLHHKCSTTESNNAGRAMGTNGSTAVSARGSTSDKHCVTAIPVVHAVLQFWCQ